jgi:hypothetical protein
MAAQNALERLADFPNMMNWRGTWLSTEQYIQNDVVISPATISAYILLDTTLLSGTDPSTNAAWTELAPSATGIFEISQGIGITVTDTVGPITTITNDGVLSVIAGANISVDNTDPQNPVISSTALTQVTAGNGITIGGLSFSPTITNIGVRTLAVGPGLTTSGDPNNPSISTSAVLSIAQGNGILVTGGQTATVTNDGIVSIDSGTGISVNNTDPRNPIISNLGILTLTEGPSIEITGTASNPIISAKVPEVTLVADVNSVAPQPPQPTPPSTLCQISIAGGSPNIFKEYINDGSPDTTGIFLLDLTSINLFLSAATPVVAGDKITVVLIDDVTTSPTPIVFTIGEILMNSSSNSYPFQIRPSQYSFNVTTLRATGFRNPTSIGFLNDTAAATLEVNSWGDIYATYYPLGLF